MSHAVHFVNDLSCSEKFAVWMIRCVARRQAVACADNAAHPEDRVLLMPGFHAEREGVIQAFRAAMRRMAALHMGHLDVGIPRATMLTATERGFLEATSAAQNGNEAAVRQALRRVFPHHHVQSRFAAAVTVLGACLAGAGHWLPSRRPLSDEGRPFAPDIFPPEPRHRPHHPIVIADSTSHDNENRRQATNTDGLIAMASWQALDMGITPIQWPHPENLGPHPNH